MLRFALFQAATNRPFTVPLSDKYRENKRCVATRSGRRREEQAVFNLDYAV